MINNAWQAVPGHYPMQSIFNALQVLKSGLLIFNKLKNNQLLININNFIIGNVLL